MQVKERLTLLQEMVDEACLEARAIWQRMIDGQMHGYGYFSSDIAGIAGKLKGLSAAIEDMKEWGC